MEHRGVTRQTRTYKATLHHLQTTKPFCRSPFLPQTIRIKKGTTTFDLVMSVHPHHFIKTFYVLKTLGFTNKLD